MNGITATFRRLLEKFRFTADIPAEVQRHAIDSGRRGLLSILRSVGAYSLYFGRVISLVYLTRRMGFRLSITSVKILLLSISAALIFAITLPAIYLLIDDTSSFERDGPNDRDRHGGIIPQDKRIITPDRKEDGGSDDRGGAEKRDGEGAPGRKDDGGPRGKEKVKEYALGVGGIEGDAELAGEITGLLIDNLKEKIRTKGVVALTASNRGAVPKIVTGSARRIGDTRILIIKLVDVSRTGIELTAVEKVPAGGSLEEACRRISNKIAGRM